MVVVKCCEEGAAYRIGPTSLRVTIEVTIDAGAKVTPL
jgi:hypothetical protein